ncbi:hypothetical protein HNQ02_001050 [Flavobacterium sp. 7E]|uniref:DUF3810 domain-containing protein n=1 Tax=Flavobacterium sp. 7E TaxID=2735898 RepID=UPI0015715B45|nr:hypothetical protein [Flavobacterium sp. 7E]
MKSKYLLPLFLVIQIIALQILAYFPESIEEHYSNGIYPIISLFSRILFGLFPFSVGDCIYIILIFFILRWFWNKRKSWKLQWKNNLLTILSFFSVFYFLFHVLWALNYYREPLFEKMEIQKEYTDAELIHFTKKLIAKTNAIHSQITKNDSLKVVFPYTEAAVFKMNLNGYDNLAKEHDYFTFTNLSTKKSLISLPLSYMGFSGYLNPFTNEAQVNSLIPLYGFPTTVNHEMAHQMGYASESECNFIGFMASIKNDNLYFKYSGYSFALSYCLSSIRMQDEATFKKLLKTVHPGILKNYKESDQFWIDYQSPIEKGFHLFYDTFLKINQQKEGMNSYSKFVDLMVNYYHKREL